MKFIANSQEANATAIKLLKRCDSLRWATAWASANHPLFELLYSNRDKIKQLSVGIHFYQTHPDFIDTFAEHPNVRFVMHPNGVFHPKVYLFENGDGTWDCLLGSFNFTQGGFKTNSEAGVHFSSNDAPSEHCKLIETLDGYFQNGQRLNSSQIRNYRAIWNRQQRRLASLSGDYEPSSKPVRKPRKSPLDVGFFVADWREYFNKICAEKGTHTTLGRLDVLENAKSIFGSSGKFSDLPSLDRQRIAGMVDEDEIKWKWFGSMAGHGYFCQAINQNSQLISSSLDSIPNSGTVTEDDYKQFVALFVKSFEKAGVGTATRLLAMKRPDYFVCLDVKNKKRLCKEFEITQSVGLDDYWGKVVARILDSNWWNSEPPTDELGLRIWNCRSAFLDAIFYEPKRTPTL